MSFVIPEKLTVVELFKKFSPFYRNSKLINMPKGSTTRPYPSHMNSV
jgi:hypothetical protein